MEPDRSLIDLSGDLWPDLGYPRRRQIVIAPKEAKLVPLIRSRPWAMAALMTTKLAPVLVATMFQLSQTAGKENVRATAAKELLRLAQTSHSKLAPSDEEPEPTEELDGLLDSATGVEEAQEEADEVGEARALTEAELME